MQRQKQATIQMRALRKALIWIVDEMDDGTMKAYAAWPDRLYLVDTDGKVVFAGGKGPWGFKPSKLKKTIEGLMEFDVRYAST